MLNDLPKDCDTGTKRNAKGHTVSWCGYRLHGYKLHGYKLHIDAIDGGIPVSCLLTAAAPHDSQAAVPLATRTAGRVDNLYDLMDSAYDAAGIRAFSERLGHVPLIAVNPRGRRAAPAPGAPRARAAGTAGKSARPQGRAGRAAPARGRSSQERPAAEQAQLKGVFFGENNSPETSRSWGGQPFF